MIQIRKKGKKGFFWLSLGLIGVIMTGMVYQVWAEQNRHEDVTYLSDINPIRHKVGWGSFVRDKEIDGNGKIRLKEGAGEPKEYSKGVGAHANAEIVYNLDNPLSLGRATFEGQIGVQAGKDRGKVRFDFYLDDQLIYSSRPITEKNPQPVIFTVKGKNQLKIVIDNLGDGTQDHAVLADAKFVNKNFSETPTEGLETDIKHNFDLAKAPNDRVLREKMLKSRFFSKIGRMEYDYFRNKGAEEHKFTDWLINDLEALTMINESEDLPGPAMEFLRILMKIRTEDPTIERDSLNKKIAIATATSNSSQVRFYYDLAQKVDATWRYKIYRNLARAEGQLMPMFESLDTYSVAQVVSTPITNEDILWLREKIKQEFPERAKTTNGISGLNHHYIQYLDQNEFGDSIHSDKFYGQNPNLGRLIERGGVCGTISKFGSMVMNSFGVPAALVGQPGHAAMVFRTDNGEPGRNNWISSWAETSGGLWSPSIDKLESIGGWRIGPVAYLSSASLKNENYQEARELYEYHHIFKDTDPEKLQILSKVIDLNPLFLPAYISRIRQIENIGEDKIALLEFSFKIMDNLHDHPAMMMMLLDRIETKINDRSMKNDFYAKYIEAIDRPKTNLVKDTIDSPSHNNKINKIRNYLGDFSFDGKNANKFIGGMTDTEYSLDGGKNWRPFKEENHQLTISELKEINPELGIMLKVRGARFPMKIQIGKAAAPILKINDQEDYISGKGLLEMEYSYNNGINWIDYSKIRPDLSGNKTVLIRYKKSGRVYASDAVKLNFTEQMIPEDFDFIPNPNISIQKFTSDEKRQGEGAELAIDGDSTTIWHSNYNRGDRQPALTLKLNKSYPIKGLHYQPRQDNSNNGTARKIKISYSEIQSDNEDNFKTLEPITIDYGNNLKKSIEIPLNFKAVIVKFQILEGENNFGSAAEIRIRTTKEEARQALAKLKKESEKRPRERLAGSLYAKRHYYQEDLEKTNDPKLKAGLAQIIEKIPEDGAILFAKSLNELNQLAQEVELAHEKLMDQLLVERYQKISGENKPTADYISENDKARAAAVKVKIAKIDWNNPKIVAETYYELLMENTGVISQLSAEKIELFKKLEQRDHQAEANSWINDFKEILNGSLEKKELKLGLAEQTFRILPRQTKALLNTQRKQLEQARKQVKQSLNNSKSVLSQMIRDSEDYIRDLDNTDLNKSKKLEEMIISAKQILAEDNYRIQNQAAYDLMMKKQIIAYEIKERVLVSMRKQAFKNLHDNLLNKPLAEISQTDKTAAAAARASYIRIGKEAQAEMNGEIKRLEAVEALISANSNERSRLIREKTKEIFEADIKQLHYPENQALLQKALADLMKEDGDILENNKKLTNLAQVIKETDKKVYETELALAYRERLLLRTAIEKVEISQKNRVEDLIEELVKMEQENSVKMPTKTRILAILESIKRRETEQDSQNQPQPTPDTNNPENILDENSSKEESKEYRPQTQKKTEEILKSGPELSETGDNTKKQTSSDKNEPNQTEKESEVKVEKRKTEAKSENNLWWQIPSAIVIIMLAGIGLKAVIKRRKRD